MVSVSGAASIASYFSGAASSATSFLNSTMSALGGIKDFMSESGSGGGDFFSGARDSLDNLKSDSGDFWNDWKMTGRANKIGITDIATRRLLGGGTAGGFWGMVVGNTWNAGNLTPMQSAWSSMTGVLSGGLGSVLDIFGGNSVGVMNGIVRNINLAIAAARNIPGFPNIPSIPLGSYTPPAREFGGSVTSNRPYLVGERGPELFVPNASGSIEPNSALGGRGGTVNMTFNLSGMTDRTDKRALAREIAGLIQQESRLHMGTGRARGRLG